MIQGGLLPGVRIVEAAVHSDPQPKNRVFRSKDCIHGDSR